MLDLAADCHADDNLTRGLCAGPTGLLRLAMRLDDMRLRDAVIQAAPGSRSFRGIATQGASLAA
jgi:hypothetical protein